MKLQQYTGPVQAKGLEDTAFYRYNVLLSINEVGGDPGRFGRSVAEFHEASAQRLRNWPLEMLTTSTHDTKLGEDVRARINAISELSAEWTREVGRWMRLNQRRADARSRPNRRRTATTNTASIRRSSAAGRSTPAAATRRPPDLVGRLQEYMLKAVREAKVHTSWLTPNQHYEDALKAFVERVLTGDGGRRFLPAHARCCRTDRGRSGW